MKKILGFLILALCCARVQDSHAQNIEGQIIANQYQYRVSGYSPNTYTFPAGTCNASGPTGQFAFAAGTPVQIVDGNPALNEIVAPTAVVNTGQTCAISIAPLNNHQLPFYIQSATAGLQEAINQNTSNPQSNTIILDNAWYQQVTTRAASIIGAAQGTVQLSLQDVTQAPNTYYIWNGTQYVETTIAGQSLATYSTPGLQGGGRAYVYPSSISTDACAAINTAGAALPAAGGTIDAMALGTATYTCTTQITALNQTGKQITLLKNQGTTFIMNVAFSGTLTDSPAYSAIPIGQGSAIIVPGKQSSSVADFQVGPSARVWDLISNGKFDGSQESVLLDGVNITGNPSGTVMGALLHLQGVFVGTHILNSGTYLCYAQCLELNPANGGVSSGASDLLFESDNFQDGASTGTYPGSVVDIDALNSSSGIGSITFIGGAIQYNGPHNPLLTVNGRGGSQTAAIRFLGTDIETHPATTSSYYTNVDPIQLTDVAQVYFLDQHVTGTINSSSQPNFADITATIQNASYGITFQSLEVPTSFGFACVIKNNVEGTCEPGFPNGLGNTALPSYTFGQIVPQIRQSNQPPPATVGVCSIGSIWTYSGGTTSATTFFGCFGILGSQTYQPIGGGGTGGGGLGTLVNDLVTNNAGNTAAQDIDNFQATPSYTPQSAITKAVEHNGTVTLNPGSGAGFTNTNNTVGVKVNDLQNLGAQPRSVTEFGAYCDASQGFFTTTATSTTVGIGNAYFYATDIGKTITLVGLVGGVPTAYEPKITAMGTGSGPNYSTAIVDTAAPFTLSSGTVAIYGHDDSAAIASAMAAAVPAAKVTALQFPAGNCLSHTIMYTGISMQGINGIVSAINGFPGEDVFRQPDPSTSTPAPGFNVHIHDMQIQIDNRVDATKPWQIVNVSGTTSMSALSRPTGIKSAAANCPTCPGWFQGSGPNNTGAIAGVGAINSGTPTSMTVPAGLTLPTVGQTIVFPYLTTVLTTTASAVNTGTRVVTLNSSYTGTTGTQIEWFAGTSVQKLSGSYSGTSCPATMTLSNSVLPSPATETNVAPFGLIQVDAEQMTYFGRTAAGTVGTNYLTITACGVNGTTKASHSSSATVVPLNPFNPTTPWPVTPTVNSNATTPVNAAFYPAWDIGNAGFAAPLANGNNGTSGTVSFADSVIDKLNINTFPNGTTNNNTACLYFVPLPYATRFESIVCNGETYGPEEGTPNLNTGGNFASAQPTADGTSWENIRTNTCNAANFISGGQNSFKDWNSYSDCNTNGDPGGGYVGANTCWYFTQAWSDQTGSSQAVIGNADLINMYCEPEFGSQYGLVPVYEFDIDRGNWSNLHMGGGGETYLGGSRQHFQGGNFNNQAVFPLINYGYNNSADTTSLLSFGYALGNVYGTNSFLSYGPNAAFSGAMSANNPLTAPYGFNQWGNSREPFHGQSNETFNTGNTTKPYVNSNSGYIPAVEFNSSASFESNPFQPWHYDAGLLPDGSPVGGSVSCSIDTGGLSVCFSYQFNQEGIGIGPGQRIVGGKYTFYIASKSTGAATSYTIKIGACGLGDTQAFSVPVTSSYSIYSGTVDFTTSATGCGSPELSMDFIYPAPSNDTISVAFVDFAPVAQQFNAFNINLLNGVHANGSDGTSGYVLTSQGTGQPDIWAAPSGGLSGLTTTKLPKATSGTTVADSCFGDSGTVGSYSCGVFQVIASTPGTNVVGAGTGTIPSGALPANSYGDVGPVTGGASYLRQHPSTAAAGFELWAAPGTLYGQNVTQSTFVHIPFHMDSVTSNPGSYSVGNYLSIAYPQTAGHFSKLQGYYNGGGCTTPPIINVFDVTASTSGTALTLNNSGAPAQNSQTLAWSAGDEVAIEITTAASGCTGVSYAISADGLIP